MKNNFNFLFLFRYATNPETQCTYFVATALLANIFIKHIKCYDFNSWKQSSLWKQKFINWEKCCTGNSGLLPGCMERKVFLWLVERQGPQTTYDKFDMPSKII